jgi:F-type H+-transporting ATPase subunit epsilon
VSEKSLLRRDLGRPAMNLEILTPEKKLFSGEVYGVQMPGISGSFEVLEKHAPLVSALKAGRIKVLKDKPAGSGGQRSFFLFDIQGGFVEVLNNKVTVLVEGATAWSDRFVRPEKLILIDRFFCRRIIMTSDSTLFLVTYRL